MTIEVLGSIGLGLVAGSFALLAFGGDRPDRADLWPRRLGRVTQGLFERCDLNG